MESREDHTACQGSHRPSNPTCRRAGIRSSLWVMAVVAGYVGLLWYRHGLAPTIPAARPIGLYLIQSWIALTAIVVAIFTYPRPPRNLLPPLALLVLCGVAEASLLLDAQWLAWTRPPTPPPFVFALLQNLYFGFLLPWAAGLSVGQLLRRLSVPPHT